MQRRQRYSNSIGKDKIKMYALDSTPIKIIHNFKYFGSLMSDSFKDFEVRTSLVWSVCNKLSKVWKSKLNCNIFLATVESVFLYRSESWTADKTFCQKLDGCYTRMLQTVLVKLVNEQLYEKLIPVTKKIAFRRMKHVRHCLCNLKEIASKLFLWLSSTGRKKVVKESNFDPGYNCSKCEYLLDELA